MHALQPQLRRLLSLFFLKTSRQYLSLADLRRQCQSEEWLRTLPVLSEWKCGRPEEPPLIASGFPYNPLAHLRTGAASRVIRAMTELCTATGAHATSGALDVMTRTMADAESSPPAGVAVLTAVAFTCLPSASYPQQRVRSVLMEWCRGRPFAGQDHPSELLRYVERLLAGDVAAALPGTSLASPSDRSVALITAHFVACLVSTLPVPRRQQTNRACGVSFFHRVLVEGFRQDILWPGLPDTEQVAVFEALGGSELTPRPGGHSRYRCTCGYIYAVGECGSPEESSTCPECGALLGESSVGGRRLDRAPITAAAAAAALSSKGYFAHRLLLDSVRVRQMTPLAATVLHFLLHAAAMGFEWLHVDSSRRDPVALPDIWAHLAKDWEHLGPLVTSRAREEGDVEVAAAIVGTIEQFLFEQDDPSRILDTTDCLQHSDGRVLWEAAFQELVDWAIEKRGELQAKMAWEACTTSGDSAVSMSKDEMELEGTASPTHEHGSLSLLFSVAEQPNARAIERCFFAQRQAVHLDYPVLSCFFAHRDRIASLEHLWPLLDLSQTVLRGCSLRLRRADAGSTSIEEYVRAGHLESVGIAHDADVDALLAPFAAAWRGCKAAGLMIRLGCHKLQPPKDISAASPVSYLCVDRSGDGKYLAAALERFAAVQNGFITALLEATVGHGSAGAPRPIQQCQRSHILGHAGDLAPPLLRFTVPGPRGPVCDFARMEAYLEAVLLGKGSTLAMLDASGLECFAFCGEAFRHDAALLVAVRGRVPQAKLPAATEKDIRERARAAADDGSRRELEVLELSLSYMQRAGVKPSEPLLGFCRRWRLDEPSCADALQVGHALALHDLYEEIEGKRRVVHLDDCFRKDLPPEVEEKLLKLWRAKFAELGQIALTMLHRLIVRFLSTGAELAYPVETPIHVLIESLVTAEDPRDGAMATFPAEWALSLQHVTAVHAVALKACDEPAGGWI